MENTEKFMREMLEWADAAYIIDEESRQIVCMHGGENLLPQDAVGMPCWKALFERQAQCINCPELTEGERYSWEAYNKNRKLWYKVSNLLFEAGGRKYRAGVISTINDVMGLNYDSVAEMTELNRLLEINRRIKDAFEREATHDNMTGLYNRNRYCLDLASEKYKTDGLGVLYFDLNNLKTVNDRYRHEAGDELILRLSAAICRVRDSIEGAEAYRIGGDEFVVFLTHVTEERMNAAKDAFYAYLEETDKDAAIPCSVALGMAYAAQANDVESLVNKADHDMYEVKKRMKSIIAASAGEAAEENRIREDPEKN